MSDDTAPSALTRLVPPLTIIALLVMIAAAIYHVVTLGSQPTPAFSRADAPSQPDYSKTQAWYVRPEAETDGGWKSPWGVDLLWLNDARNGYAGGWNAPADWLPSHIALEKDLNWIQSLEAGIGFYAPARRLAARLNGSDVDVESARKLETEDVLSALDHYVENDHKQRGFFLGGRGAGAEEGSDDDGCGCAREAPDGTSEADIARLPGRCPPERVFLRWILAAMHDVPPFETADSELLPVIEFRK